jgi:hypothetical protein
MEYYLLSQDDLVVDQVPFEHLHAASRVLQENGDVVGKQKVCIMIHEDHMHQTELHSQDFLDVLLLVVPKPLHKTRRGMEKLGPLAATLWKEEKAMTCHHST